MNTDARIILGIPIDNLTLAKVVGRIFSLIEAYSPDQRPRLVVTVNVDFLVKALAWFGGVPDNPEVVDILRRADLRTADGMPLVWSSRLLGAPLPERVTGADLVPALAVEAARQSKSLYLLGGQKEVAESAAQILQEGCPGLKIAGIDSPFVYTEGDELAEASEADQPICERINNSGADILLVAFGNPKQEIWFRRNQDRLRVPVVIGIGGTFNFIAGTVARAPGWMQRLGVEWLYRVCQEPGRLWQRYLLGLAKFSTMILPSIWDYRWHRLLGHGGKPDGGAWTHFLSGARSLQVLSLPRSLDRRWAETGALDFEQAFAQDALVVDFAQMRLADAAGLASLIEGLVQVREQNQKWYAVGVKPAVRRTLKRNRVWDLLKARVCGDVPELVSRLGEVWPECRCLASIKAEAGFMGLGFCGRLSGAVAASLDVETLLRVVAGQDRVLDLSYCSELDAQGLALLLKLSRGGESDKGRCLICGMTAEVERRVKSAKLDVSLPIVANMAAAKAVFAMQKHRKAEF
jgi:exopolysaccharide biosynthesis WecB/TagA/CpsF family protein